MNREEIKQFCLNNVANYAIQLKRHHKEDFDLINSKYSFPTMSEKIYSYVNDDVLGKCKICGNKPKFDGYWKGYRLYCSYKCSDIDIARNCREYRNCVICDAQFLIYKKREKTTCSQECLFKLNSTKEVNDKRQISLKKTLLVKYGVDHNAKLPDFNTKTRKTKLERHGNPAFVNLEKSKFTRLKKYGDEHYNNINKFKKTFRDKYGVDNFSKTPEFKVVNFKRVVSRLTAVTPLFDINSYSGIKIRNYSFRCNVCNAKFISYLDCGNIPTCRICNPINRELEQQKIVEFITVLLPSVSIQTSNRTILRPKELDIYIPSKKISIEYNGIYWHGELSGKKNQTYHLNKTEGCLKLGIKLIHIFENEWLYKRDVVKSKLINILKPDNQTIIEYKNCKIEPITEKECNVFLDKNDFYYESGTIQYGLFYNNELISVISFKTTENLNEYELLNLCTFNNKVIKNVDAELLNYFIKTHTPDKIVTYVDRRWNADNTYEKLGFILDSIMPPNYWYFDLNDTSHIFHRYDFIYSELSCKLASFDENLTEWENMQLNGYDRIWDCGNLKYVWNKPIN